MSNTDLVKGAYENFATGNTPAVLAPFDPAIEWRECPGVVFVNDDGIFIGPEAVVTNVFMQIGVYYDGFTIAVTDVFGSGDKVAMAGYYQDINKATGNPFKANVAHFWTVKNGKLSHFFQALDTVSMAG